MRILALFLVAAALAGGGVADAGSAKGSWTEALQDPAAAASVRAWAMEAGVGAMIVGQCEKHLPSGATDNYLAGIADLQAGGADEYLSLRVRDVVFDSYAKGRNDALGAEAQGQLDRQVCEKLIAEHLDLVNAAGRTAANAVRAYHAKR